MDTPSEITADFEAYQNRVVASLKAVTSGSVRISSQDLGFHRSSSEKVSKSLASQNAHLLRLTNKLLKCATKDSNVKAPTIQNVDSLEDNWRNVVDVIDDLLEKADASLDEYNGVIKRLSPARQDSPSTPPGNVSNGTSPRPQMGYSGIVKPQLRFERKVNNYAEGPWKPLLREKPHAQVPLEESIGQGEQQWAKVLSDRGYTTNIHSYKHPYAHEIETSKYPDFVYQDKLPIPFTRPENSEAKFIDTESGLKEMLEELKAAKEIAIDLEHNDKNSYVGLVCLMQISTRNKDWIVDTLKPWRENLQILNEVFADPKIIKVFHGSTMDMIWLQRDLGLYIVGLFDTYHACVELNFPGRSLAFLLQKYAYFQAQKQYQLADWRVRPLPKELLDYARSDTHYLLYIYDNLRNELLRQSTDQDNLIDRVQANSKKEALQTYERIPYDRENGLGPSGWMKLVLPKTFKQLTNEQFGVLRALHEWRDQKARQYDEGDNFIMPNNYLWQCAELMPLSRYELFKFRVGKAPRFISEHTDEFISVIKKGKIDGQNGPSVQEVIDRNADKLGPLRDVKRIREQKPQDVNRSVAATLQRLSRTDESSDMSSSSADMTSQMHTIVSRSNNSQFWGAMKPIWHPIRTNFAAAAQALQSVLPIQSFGQPSVVEEPSLQKPTTDTPQAVNARSDFMANDVSETSPNGIENDVFILSDRKKKRKVDEASLEEGELDAEPVDTDEELSTNGVGQPLDMNEQPTGTGNKRERQAAKKARKRAEKAEHDATVQTNQQPFDYANAPSLLNASPVELASRNPKDRPFNPFAKALDTSTGAKRGKMGKEQPGKSHTFKS